MIFLYYVCVIMKSVFMMVVLMIVLIMILVWFLVRYFGVWYGSNLGCEDIVEGRNFGLLEVLCF